MASTSGEVCNAPEYVELQRQFDEFQAQSEEFERELEEDKRAVEAELVQTEQRLDAALKRAKRLDDELATAHEKTQRQARGFNDMVEEVAGLKQANEALTGRVQTLEQANDNFEREVRALHASEEAALQKQEHAEEELILVKDELKEATRTSAEQAERRRRELQELQQELDRARAHATPTVREKFEAATVAAETVAALRTLEAALRTLEVQFEYPRR